jgi:hypothetical protein
VKPGKAAPRGIKPRPNVAWLTPLLLPLVLSACGDDACPEGFVCIPQGGTGNVATNGAVGIAADRQSWR